jgi:predicted porin
MQNKIIALAIATAFSAPAFADTSVYGVVDAALVHISADGQKSDLQAVSGGLSASRLGVKSVEDIGDMKAIVVLEYGLDTQVNATIGMDAGINLTARQQMLALTGGSGTFATGFLQTAGYDWALKFDPTAGSSVSPLQSFTAYSVIGSNTIASRSQRALAYISPDMGGMTVAVNYSTGFDFKDPGSLGNLGIADTAADKKLTATLLSATYSSGPLSVGGVYAKVVAPGALGGLKEYALGASYDLSMIKLFATYQSLTSDSSTNPKDKVYSVSAVAPAGPGAVVFSYAKGKTTETGYADIGGNGVTVGWLQGLSKLTTAYVTLSKVSNEAGTKDFSVDNNAVAGSTLTAGGSSTMLAAGLNKKF